MTCTTATGRNTPETTQLRGVALVVDDESANRLLLEMMLRREGFEVVTAENGATAVSVFTSRQIDIVFMDVMMPVMDGYTATRLIKDHAGDVFVPVIFLTALRDTEAMVKAIASGGDDLLGKPFNFVVLNARIRAMERVRNLHRTIADKHANLSIMHEQVVLDQEFAQQIFQRVLTEHQRIPDCVRFFQRSAATFCGDLVLTDTLADGSIRLLVADFTGHGLAAAVGSVPVADVFKRANESGHDDFTLLRQLNKRLHRLLPADVFMATCLVTLRRDGFSYWNGGLPASYLLRTSGVSEMKSNHLALGILPDLGKEDRPDWYGYEDARALIVCSDGLVEALDMSGRQLGASRVRSCLAASDLSANCALDALSSMARMHVGDSDLRDDLTVAVIDFSCMRRHARDSSTLSLLMRVALDFQGAALMRPNLSCLLAAVSEFGLSQTDRAALELITTELFNNALDHGVLNLDSNLKHDSEGFSEYYEQRSAALLSGPTGQVSVRFNLYGPDSGSNGRFVLDIEVEDSGDGFDSSRWLAANTGTQGECVMPWGRGISVVSGLCERVEYSDIGNHVTATYSWVRAE